MTLPAGIERLANGNTVICDAGSNTLPTARVIEIDSNEHLVWAYIHADILWAHTATRLDNGNTLITATDSNRVFEVTPRRGVVWDMRSGLRYPNEAYYLANGHFLITDRDNNRVIEVDSLFNIVWSYTNLTGPHGANRLPNGNTLISNSSGSPNRIVEVDPLDSVVWQYATGLSWPRSCQRLANGNTLIGDSYHNRAIEVDSIGTIVWTLTGLSTPFQAARLANGHTMVSTGARVIEVDAAKNIVWQYPPVSAVAVETLRVINPTDGCSLYVHIHYPKTAGPSAQVPGVVLVPDVIAAGTTFDSNGMADSIASDGFAVLHFDAEGRGRSSGTENYDGSVNQDGLAACAAVLAARPYVDTTNLGIYSRGYGVVMATGMIARHSTPHIKFLMDFEGPSDRNQMSSDSGGPIPYPVDSDAFWQQREAGRFIKSVPGAYLRIQTATDHTGRIPDNHHAIALIDSATATTHGGAGMSVWTRVNDSVMNLVSHTYSISSPPAWVPEQEERNELVRDILYLHELADSIFVHDAVSSSPLIPHPSSLLSISPNPCHGSALLRLSAGPLDHPATLRVFDVSGRVHSTFGIRTSTFRLDLRSMPAGVYLLRLSSGDRCANARLVVD
ncbi:MAG TPA: T9SS type A sorting domain-containing protein [bacterium]|nr:T9SS type A sorting domain-containing protein [bacterium]